MAANVHTPDVAYLLNVSDNNLQNVFSFTVCHAIACPLAFTRQKRLLRLTIGYVTPKGTPTSKPSAYCDRQMLIAKSDRPDRQMEWRS